MLDNLYIKLRNKISTYNVNFMCYTSQLGWVNSILCHCYYQSLPNCIQDPISTQKQGKPTSFQNMYALVITIDYHYQECNYKYHYARQVEKKAFKSHSQKQGKAFSTGNIIASLNKANTFLVASSAKSSPSNILFPTPKKQSNSPQVDLFSKLANNNKLTSNQCKKYLKNNLCLYCGVGDHKLDSCPKKQITVTFKDHGTLAAASKKPSGLYTD